MDRFILKTENFFSAFHNKTNEMTAQAENTKR